MTTNRPEHHRRSIRLHGYDYSLPGRYFVTVCAQGMLKVFGRIDNGKVILSQIGEIAAETWQWLENQYSYVQLDEWVLMPNHLHGIIQIVDETCRGGSRTAPTILGEHHEYEPTWPAPLKRVQK
jgi:hypothetical protein